MARVLMEWLSSLYGATQTMFSYLKGFSNGKRTKWSTIQGVIRHVISKLDECTAQSQCEIASVMTPWTVWHKFQLLINSINHKFQDY